MRSPAALVAVTVALAIALTGCDDGSPSDVVPTRSFNTTAPTATPTAPAGPALVVRPAGGGIICVEEVSRRSDFGYWDGTVVSRRSLVITGIRARAGRGVRVAGAKYVPRRGGRRGDVPSTGLFDWSDASTRPGFEKWADLRKARPLAGATLSAGERIFPYVHLRVDPGTRMKGIEIAYLTTDDDKAGVAFMDAAMAFHRGKC